MKILQYKLSVCRASIPANQPPRCNIINEPSGYLHLPSILVGHQSTTGQRLARKCLCVNVGKRSLVNTTGVRITTSSATDDLTLRNIFINIAAEMWKAEGYENLLFMQSRSNRKERTYDGLNTIFPQMV